MFVLNMPYLHSVKEIMMHSKMPRSTQEIVHNNMMKIYVFLVFVVVLTASIWFAHFLIQICLASLFVLNALNYLSICDNYYTLILFAYAENYFYYSYSSEVSFIGNLFYELQLSIINYHVWDRILWNPSGFSTPFSLFFMLIGIIFIESSDFKLIIPELTTFYSYLLPLGLFLYTFGNCCDLFYRLKSKIKKAEANYYLMKLNEAKTLIPINKSLIVKQRKKYESQLKEITKAELEYNKIWLLYVWFGEREINKLSTLKIKIEKDLKVWVDLDNSKENTICCDNVIIMGGKRIEVLEDLKANYFQISSFLIIMYRCLFKLFLFYQSLYSFT